MAVLLIKLELIRLSLDGLMLLLLLGPAPEEEATYKTAPALPLTTALATKLLCLMLYCVLGATKDNAAPASIAVLPLNTVLVMLVTHEDVWQATADELMTIAVPMHTRLASLWALLQKSITIQVQFIRDSVIQSEMEPQFLTCK